MKKFFPALAAAFLLIACGESSSSDNSTTTTDTASAAPAEVAPAPDSTSTASAGTVKDGVMAMKDGKMVVMKGGNWEPMKEAVTTTNGRKVSTSGEVSKGDRKRKLEEGMMIDKDGQLMDKDGKPLDNTGWE